MNIPSIKKHIVSGLSFGVSKEEMKGNALYILASAGVIMGTLIDEIDYTDKIDSTNFLPHATRALVDSYRKEYSLEDVKFGGNDGYLILKDVTVVQGANKFNFGNLIVFFDQIIAVTLGSANELIKSM